VASPIAFARALVSAAALVASDSVMISFGEKKPDNRTAFLRFRSL